MSKKDLKLDEISERIADAILEERFFNKKTLIEKIKPLLKIWTSNTSVPNKKRRTADTHKLQWTIAKNIAEKRYWLNVLRKEIGEEKVKPYYDECRKHIADSGYGEYKET